MSLGAILYVVSMAVLFVGQRLLVDAGAAQTGVTVLGLVLLLAAAALRLRTLRAATSEGLKFGHRIALIGLMVGAASLVLYAATTDAVLGALAMTEQAETRWLGTWRSLWPLVWLLGTAPMLAVDYACESSPVMMPRRRVRELALHGLVAAMGLGLVFPINYVASQKKERWDLAYFKTPQPGTATVALAQSLEAPVDVRIFMPPSSEVAQELLAYFGPLQGPNLRVQVIDQAAEPRLAKALSVRDNGTIAFTQGELGLDAPPPAEGEEPPPKPITRTVKVNPDFDKAKRSLKKIDADVQKMLIELGQGDRVAYVTTGHGELGWKQQPTLDRQIKGLREELKNLGFTVKELGFRQGLLEAVPDDADIVMVLGPLTPLQPREIQSLRAYLESGGSLLIGLNPRLPQREGAPLRPDPLADMVEEVMGVALAEGVLADERNHAPLYKNVRDNYLVVSDAFSSHSSNGTLAGERSPILMPVSGVFEVVEGHEAGASVTVRSMATSFADLNGNGTFEADAGETKGARGIVAAVSGGTGAVRWRAIVTANAGMLSDVGVGNADGSGSLEEGLGIRGNLLFVRDAANWLIGAEALSGTTQSEEDVKIEHTKDGQTWWFYSTVLGVPLAVFVLGALRVSRRRRGHLNAEGGKR